MSEGCCCALEQEVAVFEEGAVCLRQYAGKRRVSLFGTTPTTTGSYIWSHLVKMTFVKFNILTPNVGRRFFLGSVISGSRASIGITHINYSRLQRPAEVLSAALIHFVAFLQPMLEGNGCGRAGVDRYFSGLLDTRPCT